MTRAEFVKHNHYKKKLKKEGETCKDCEFVGVFPYTGNTFCNGMIQADVDAYKARVDMNGRCCRFSKRKLEGL